VTVPRDAGKWLRKKAKAGNRGYPIGTVAFYGPDDLRATKIAAAVIEGDGEAPTQLERWTVETGDVRRAALLSEVIAFFKANGVRSISMMERIIGCPHEEGVDYPEGGVCPACPFWAGRDRWSGSRAAAIAAAMAEEP
jgi:hypothetical protein